MSATVLTSNKQRKIVPCESYGCSEGEDIKKFFHWFGEGGKNLAGPASFLTWSHQKIARQRVTLIGMDHACLVVLFFDIFYVNYIGKIIFMLIVLS